MPNDLNIPTFLDFISFSLCYVLFIPTDKTMKKEGEKGSRESSKKRRKSEKNSRGITLSLTSLPMR